MATGLSLDGVLTYIGCCLVTGPPVLLVSSFVQSSTPATPLLPFVVLLVGVPVTICYQRAGKSLGDLGTFIFATAALNLVFGFSLLFAFRTFGTVLGAEELSIPAIALVIAVEYALGYYLVYRKGYARLKSTIIQFG